MGGRTVAGLSLCLLAIGCTAEPEGQGAEEVSLAAESPGRTQIVGRRMPMPSKMPLRV